MNDVRPPVKSSFVRFLLSGAFNTAVTYGLYLLLLNVLAYQASYTIAYVTGIVLAFVLNRFFVFQSHRGLTSIILFPTVYLAQYLLNLIVVWLWVDRLHLSDKLAPLAAIALSVPVTYGLSRHVFKPRAVPPKP
ncbi:GtrA family protein [Pseudomonas putida]